MSFICHLERKSNLIICKLIPLCWVVSEGSMGILNTVNHWVLAAET